MPNLLRSRRIVAVVIALASVAVLGAAGALVTSAKAAYTLTVIVGNGKGGIAAQAFMPADVVIAEGDSIKFLNPYEQIHTTTFLAGGPEQLFMIPDPANPSRIILNPATAFPTAATEFDGSAYANSGVMGQSPGQSKSWTLTFTEAGVYDFLCVIHPGMEGTVTVKNLLLYVSRLWSAIVQENTVRDMFGADEVKFTPKNHLGTNRAKLCQIQSGRWVSVTDYITE